MPPEKQGKNRGNVVPMGAVRKRPIPTSATLRADPLAALGGKIGTTLDAQQGQFDSRMGSPACGCGETLAAT